MPQCHGRAHPHSLLLMAPPSFLRGRLSSPPGCSPLLGLGTKALCQLPPHTHTHTPFDFSGICPQEGPVPTEGVW